MNMRFPYSPAFHGIQENISWVSTSRSKTRWSWFFWERQTGEGKREDRTSKALRPPFEFPPGSQDAGRRHFTLVESQCVHRMVTSQMAFFLAVPGLSRWAPDRTEGRHAFGKWKNREGQQVLVGLWWRESQEEGADKREMDRSMAEHGGKPLTTGMPTTEGWMGSHSACLCSHLGSALDMTLGTSCLSPSFSFLIPFQWGGQRWGGWTHQPANLPPAPSRGLPCLAVSSLMASGNSPPTSLGLQYRPWDQNLIPRYNYPLHKASLYQAGALAALL